MSHSVWFGQRWCVCLLYFYIFFFVFKKEKSKYFLPLSKFMYKCLTVRIVYVIHQKHFCTSPEKLIVGHYSMVVCKLKICISAPFKKKKKHKHRTKISIGHNQEVLWTRLDLSPPQHLECGWFLNYKKQTLQIHTLPFGFASTSWTNFSCGAGSIFDHV